MWLNTPKLTYTHVYTHTCARKVQVYPHSLDVQIPNVQLNIYIISHRIVPYRIAIIYRTLLFFFSIRNLVCVHLNFLSVQVSKPRLRCAAQCSASISLLMLPSHYFFFCFTKKSIYAIGIYWVFVFLLFVCCGLANVSEKGPQGNRRRGTIKGVLYTLLAVVLFFCVRRVRRAKWKQMNGAYKQTHADKHGQKLWES